MLQDIPYRCARCSEARIFSTIAELKSHMANEHAYGQRRERAKIFDFKLTDRPKGLGRHSPVLQSYLDEGKRLEEEVRRAKKDELNNKLQRYQQVSSKPRQFDESLFTSFGGKGEVKVNFTTTARQHPEQDAYLRETLTNLNQEVLMQRHNNWQTADTLYKAQEVLAGVEEAAENCVGEQKNVILQLSKELTAKELQIQHLNMELKKLQDNRVAQNQTANDTDEREGQESKEKLVIEEEISKKKTELEYISNKLFKAKQDLKNKKQRDKKRSQKQDDSEQVKATNFNKKVATDSSYVTTEEDLSDYSTSQASYSLSKTFSTTTRDRSPNIKSPKHDKVSKNELRQKRLDHQKLHQESQAFINPEQLRAERQELLQRMKEMLSKAAFENEKLKDRLVAKENQLHSLNYELEKSKTDQTELMEETYDLYQEAEKNLTKLKEMLKVKEAQLGLANSRLDEFRSLQEQLSKEKETIAKDANEKDSQIQNLIKERDEQIEQLSRKLTHFQEEQERLSVVAADLKKEVLAKEKTHEDLQKAITDKEQELQKAKEDLETLSTFLQTAAAKESIARSKLEAFVTELIDRADKAEQELQMLRRLSSNSSANLTFNPSQARGAFPNANAVPVQGSAVFSASLSPQPYALNSCSTPLSHLNHTQRLHPYGDQILQTSLEPWYKNLGLVKDSGNSQKTVPAEVAAGECSIGGTCNELPSSLHQSVHPQQSQLLPSQSQISASGCLQADDATRQQLRMHRKSSAHNSLYQEEAARQISDSSEEFAPLPARRPVPKQRRQPQGYRKEQAGQSYVQVPSESKSRLHGIPSCSPAVYEVTSSPLQFGNISANARRHRRYGADHVSDDEQESYHSDSSAFHPPHPQYDNHSHFSMSHNVEKKVVRGKNKRSHHLNLEEGHQQSCLPDKHHKNSGHRSSSQKHSLSRDVTDSLSQNPEMIEEVGAYKTYTVLSVSAKAVEGPAIFSKLNKYSTDLEQSTSVPSKQKSSHYSDKQLLWKGKHNLSIPHGKHHLKQMHGGAEISSLDGLELSLDDDGIMWEAANVNSDAFDSNRMSPYGSETTGDVDSSVLCSSKSHINSKSAKGDDTDEDVADLQEEDSLQMLALPDEELEENAAGAVPLGERISRILKNVAKEEKSEINLAINCHDNSNPPISQQKRESPLDRAMAVRERVKSMTLPRPREKSPSEGLPSQLVQKKDAKNQREDLAKQRTEPHGVMQANIGHKTQPEFDTLDDMSSSSYAAVNIKPAYGKCMGQSVGEKGIAGSGKGVDKMLSRFELAGPWEDQGKAGECLFKPPSSPGREMLPKMDGAHVLPEHHLQALHERCSPLETSAPSAPVTDGAPITLHQHLETPSTEVSEKGALVHDNLDRDASKVKKEFSTSGSPLMRQASIMLEEQNLQQFETAALKPAKELRARFMTSHSSSEDSSLHSLSLPAKPVTLTNQEDESTDMDMDYDLESDLQNLSVPAVGRGHGISSGRSIIKKARALQRKPRNSRTAGARYGKQAIFPEITDDSNSGASDADLTVNRQQEEKRHRRIALFCVFSYLDVPTLGIVALVCKEWRRISRHPALWRRVQIKYQCVSSKFLITISKWCTQLTSLTLEGLRAGQRQAGETLDEYNRRTKACLEPGLEELLKVSQDSLTTVSIVACSNILTDKCLWLVSGYCRLLERLTYISDTHPLTAEVMWALGGGCPSITSLMVPPLHTGTLKQGLTNRCLLLMAQFYPDLLQLGIGGHALDATGLVPLVQSCQRLQFLSLNHIKELKDDTIAAMCKAGLRQLQRLELNCIPLKAEAIRNFYNSCRHLKELKVTVSIHDYWEDARKKKNREDYKKILASLEELKSQAGLGNVLRLQAASVD